MNISIHHALRPCLGLVCISVFDNLRKICLRSHLNCTKFRQRSLAITLESHYRVWLALCSLRKEPTAYRLGHRMACSRGMRRTVVEALSSTSVEKLPLWQATTSAHVECVSSTRTLVTSVPQGAFLGQVVFSLFVNHIPSVLSNSEAVIYMVNTALIYVRDSASELQEIINEEVKTV